MRLPSFNVNVKCGNELAKYAILQSTSCDYFKSEIVTSFSTMSVYTFYIAARGYGRRSKKPVNLTNTTRVR